MTAAELCQVAEQLEREIEEAPAETRLSLQPQFSNIISIMKKTGFSIPPRLRSLESVLLDEVIEDRFDNMPV